MSKKLIFDSTKVKKITLHGLDDLNIEYKFQISKDGNLEIFFKDTVKDDLNKDFKDKELKDIPIISRQDNNYKKDYIIGIDSSIYFNILVKYRNCKEFKDLANDLYEKSISNESTINLEKRLVTFLKNELHFRSFYKKLKIDPLISKIIGIIIYLMENIKLGRSYSEYYEVSYDKRLKKFSNYTIGKYIIENSIYEEEFSDFLRSINYKDISHKKSKLSLELKNKYRFEIENNISNILENQYGIENTLLSGIKNIIIEFVKSNKL